MSRAIDITGMKFGELTVIERDYEEDAKHPNRGSTYWKCKCSCGNEKTVLRASLTSGKTQSCGCLRRKVAQKRMSKMSSENYIDETGKRYGKLTVIKKIENTFNTRAGVMWQCLCDCGNIKNVIGVDLRQGLVSSCGCLGKSKGEYIIEELLNNNNILYIKEFPQKINNRIFRFDFAIVEDINIKYLIEFDGSQHTQASDLFGGNEYLKYIQENDNIKNQWCINNNIPLIRIPYTHLQKIDIKDLLVNSCFLIDYFKNT